jgi:multisubunit Na+/H+ antiporter MnhB subunit
MTTDPGGSRRDGEDRLAIPARGLLVDSGERDGHPFLRALLGGAALMGATTLATALLSTPARPPILPALVAEELSASGVSNPVTAVLLNFRSYDTLLEVAVLLVAMVAVWSMDRGARILGRERGEMEDDPVLRHLTRLVVPLAGVVAVYLTWAGSRDTGGAFQAGALLAGAGVLLVTAGFLRPPDAETRIVRGAVALGLFTFIAVGLTVIPFTGAFLQYPAGWAYPLILGIEAVLTVAIAVVLVELFVDVPAVPDPDPALETLDPTGDPLGRVLPLRTASGEEEQT